MVTSIFPCLSSLGASKEPLWVCSGRFPRKSPRNSCAAKGGQAWYPQPLTVGCAASSPPHPDVPGGRCRAALAGSRECRRRSLPRGVCPGQTNPRNLASVYKKPRGCSVSRSIWERLGLEQGLSRCCVITWVLLRPHQSCQPLISGDSWHDKGTSLSPALCPALGLGFGCGWDTAPL